MIILEVSGALEAQNKLQEKTVDAFTLLDSLNDLGNNHDSILKNISAMYHVLHLPKKLQEFTKNDMGHIENCDWIYSFTANRLTSKLSKPFSNLSLHEEYRL